MKSIIRKIKQFFEPVKAFNDNNSGIGVIEVLLILVVLIGLVMIFKSQISGIVTSAFNAINGNVSNIID